MSLEPNDPRLTSYAVGEMNDEEREQLERELDASPEARRAVEELRGKSAALRNALKDAEALELSEEQRAAIVARSRAKSSRLWIAPASALAVAAVAVLAIASLTQLALQSPMDTLDTTAVTPQRSAAPAAPVETNRRAEAEPTPPPATMVLRAAPPPAPRPAATSAPPPRGYETLGSRVRSRRPDIPQGFGSPAFNTEAYDRIGDNPFLETRRHPLSTFSIDVDTASYANVRRFISRGMLPPPDAVRIEEMLNYFSYDYAEPIAGQPFSVAVEVADAPWRPEHRLLRIALKARKIPADERPSSNLVFLLDVSGSMQSPNKLPLLKRALRLLVESLGENDRVAIVVYAGSSGLVLPSTSCDEQARVIGALERLRAGGSTNGGAGIGLAYDTAVANLIPGGINRVVLATDGDFNVGVTDQGSLTRLIEEKAKSGVFLSVLGFGMGNYKDSTLEKLADRGNGNFAYIDTLNEAKKVLVRELGATLVTVAKDVKLQLELNPAEVQSYRLIGYENRVLRAEDFIDDEKDAGEIGAGHRVTALYELVPAAARAVAADVDPLRYQRELAPSEAAANGELLTLKLRYKEPDSATSRLLRYPVRDAGAALAEASSDFKFAAAVASFGMLLRDSPHKGDATIDSVLELAEEGRASDRHGYRAEMIQLVRQVARLRRR